MHDSFVAFRADENCSVMTDERAAQVREVRRRLARNGPDRSRDNEGDFERVTLPEIDCDLLRDLLIAEAVASVVEVGLAYASSALAIGEALVVVDSPEPRHVVIDPFQADVWDGVGWDLMRSAGLESIATLLLAPSSIALPQLTSEGFSADAAFVDGSHRFHEVFLDFYFLRKIVRPGGLIVIDDHYKPSVRAAAHYYERNLGWTVVPDAFAAGTWRTIGKSKTASDGGGVHPEAGAVPRCCAFRLPAVPFEPSFDDFRPF